MEVEGSSASGSTGQEGPSAYALETKLWVGRDRLKVFFFNPEVLKDEGWTCGKSLLNVDNILSWANSWNPSTSPDIPDFRLTDKQEDADIRVKFEGKSDENSTSLDHYESVWPIQVGAAGLKWAEVLSW